jgi:hypothetical protein
MENQKVLIVKKSGYNIWGEINPKTKRIFNFSLSGVNVNPKTTYTYLFDAEKVLKRILGENK